MGGFDVTSLITDDVNLSIQIFLADETIAGNIAFGIPQDDKEMDAVIKAAKISNLHVLVMDQ